MRKASERKSAGKNTGKNIREKDIRLTSEEIEKVNNLAMQYMPFVRKNAGRYKGGGAEYEDLVQEGFLILRRLVIRWLRESPPQSLPQFIWRQGRGHIRDAAARERKRRAIDSIEQLCEDIGFDVPFCDRRFAEFDLLEALSDDDRLLAVSLAGGMTQSQLADELGITQQAVSCRLHRLRKKMKGKAVPARYANSQSNC